MMAKYPASINIFALVRIEDRDNLWMKGKDEKTRQLISDRIGEEFIGTAEMDDIIYTILDLEQYTGQGVNWVTGKTFEQIILDKGGYLPNKMARYCTSEMKIKPIFDFLQNTAELPVRMRIGYRFGESNETNRMIKLKERADENGLESYRTIVGRSKKGNQNKWGYVPYRITEFPLIEDKVPKDVIYNYWNDKPVRFAYRNNCVGCVNRNPLFLSHMANKDPDTFNWFIKQEELTGNNFDSKVLYKDVLNFGLQNKLFDDDFNDCDSGYCGL